MAPTQPDALTPGTGQGVLHLFLKVAPLADRSAVEQAVKAAVADGVQVVPVALLGHKADLALMALSPDLWRLQELQAGIGGAGLGLVDPHVPPPEIPGYAQGGPDEPRQAPLVAAPPAGGKGAWCFYPMSKRRNVDQN